jgi:hypothetical protein
LESSTGYVVSYAKRFEDDPSASLVLWLNLEYGVLESRYRP